MNKLQVFYPVEGELVPVSFVISGRTEPGRVVTAGTVSAVAGQDGIFSLPFHAENPFYDLTLTDGVSEQRLRFVCDTDLRKRYNFFIDDNVFFLTEIARKQYKSVFESFYLDFLRTLHRKYGFKVTLNMFYDNAHDPDHFNTSELDTRYRSEFEDNAEEEDDVWISADGEEITVDGDETSDETADEENYKIFKTAEVTHESSFFGDTYHLSVTTMPHEMDTDELAMLGISGDNFFKLVVAVTMPGTITAEGATITENTASFTITDLDEEQVLTVESASTNVAGMIAVGIAVIVLIVILILVFGRKKPQQNCF